MSLSKGSIVKISYTGRVKANNQVFDTTDEKLAKENHIHKGDAFLGPITVVVGEKQVLPGLDDALAEMKLGESKSIEVPPAKGFGERDPSKLVMTPLKEFKARNINPYPGLVIEADNQKARVRSVSGGRVQLDFNNEMAGKTLVYDLKVDSVLKTPEEQVKGFFEKAFPYAKASEQVFSVNGKDVKIKLSEKVFDNNVAQMSKKMFCADVFKFVNGVESIEFNEVFKKPSK